MPYKAYQVQNSPTAMLSPYGQSWSRAYGCVKDYLLQQTKLGVKLRFPDANYASADALGALGDERLIDAVGAFSGGTFTNPVTGVTESLASYATRVKNAWGPDLTPGGAWYWGGTPQGMLTAFAQQGYFPTIVTAGGLWWKLSPATVSGVAVSSVGSSLGLGLWNTFLVMMDPTPASWTNPLAETSYGIMPSGAIPGEDEVNKLRRIVNLWRPAHTICAGIEVILSGRVWGYQSGGTLPRWGTGTWGGSVVKYQVPPLPPF